MESEERPCGLVRISDYRQLIVNPAASDLFKQSGRLLLQINTCDMWEAADVEELDKQVRSGVDEFEIRYRALRSPTSNQKLDLVGSNRIINLEGVWYRFVTNSGAEEVELVS